MLRVLQSYSAGRETTNPYLKQLYRSISTDTEVDTFSWKAALLLDFDVLHVHWPEVLLRGASRPKTWFRRWLFLALMIRIRFSRRALVRTLHNPKPHEPGPWAERRLLALCDRWTTLFIRLVDTTPTPDAGRAQAVTIAHGSYRDWFAEMSVPPAAKGRLLYFGLIRAYKGVSELLTAFRDLDENGMSLRIVGSVRDPELASSITAATVADDRISARLEYLPDAGLAVEIGAAELVVLPYRDMHNSGAALLALSLNRPILVPENVVTSELATEVGKDWVHTFAGELTPQILRDALTAFRVADPDGTPDLTAREWAGLGAAHVAAYHQARSLRLARSR